MTSFYEELTSHMEGEVHHDPITRRVYSVDASIFEVEPLAIVIPKTKQDIKKALEIAGRYNIPVTPRGAATGITGGCLGKGLIFDLSVHFNNILSIQIEELQQTAHCQAGVVQDTLNTQLASFGYRLGPDTSTGNRATLGGMLANNAAGARSLRYGRMVDAIRSVDLILANGEEITFGSVSEEEWRQKKELPTTEGSIYQAAWSIKEKYSHEILKRYPHIPRRVSGYNLDELIKNDSFNMAKLIAGSEGTLGIITSMTLDIVPKANASGLCLVTFNDLIEAMSHVPALLHFNPSALEIIDDKIIELGRASPSLRGQLDWLIGNPRAILIIEIDGSNTLEVEEKLNTLSQEIKHRKIGLNTTNLLNPKEIAHVWTLRKAGLGLLLSKRSYSRAIAFIEDISISPDRLASFMEQFCAYLRSKGKQAGIYGHVGSGCMHIRPYIDLRQPQELELMRQIMLDVTDLLLRFGGTLSGEHGDGLIRSWLNPRLYGKDLMLAFKTLKHAFDPDNRMNPGKIVEAEEAFDQLRLSPKRPIREISTFLNFEKEGGFSLAADLCNGNGQCRKKEGVMCPSFQVTNQEFHSTRARAQALRGIIQGHLPVKDLTSHGMHDVMDLCLSCKGCKTECPSQVDMAKMKAEFLYHYQEEHGYSLRTKFFGNIGRMTKWMSPFAGFFNRMQQSWLAKKMLNWLHITTKRALPQLAKETFSQWFKKTSQNGSLSNTVVLFNDTFTEFNEPSIGQGAVKVLNALGFQVIVPPWSCCGRPALTKGLLKKARENAEKVIETILPYALKGIPIIGLEPSCILTIFDDYQGLVSSPMRDKAVQVSKHCCTFDEFISRQLQNGQLPLAFKNDSHVVKVHGHCHQKALVGMKPTLMVLQGIPNVSFSEIQSGCCGMAGSFGYEKEHYSLSLEIGELRLFPAIREASSDTLLVANGTSCRHQISDGTQRKALHLAEFLAQIIE